MSKVSKSGNVKQKNSLQELFPSIGSKRVCVYIACSASPKKELRWGNGGRTAGPAATPGAGRGSRGGAGDPAELPVGAGGGKRGASGAVLPRGAQTSSSIVRTVDSIQPHTDNFPRFN